MRISDWSSDVCSSDLLGIGEGAVLFQEGGAGKEDMRVIGGFVQEQVLHHHAFHRLQPRGDVMGVGIGLEDILALNEDALERAVGRGVQHVGDTKARRSEEHTSELQSLMRISYAVFCLKKKKYTTQLQYG